MPLLRGKHNKNMNVGLSLPKLGDLRKGELVPNASGEGSHPADLNYFRVTFEERFQEQAEPLFRELYGDEPTEFSPVLLLGDTPDEAFPQWYEQHRQGMMLRRCDGVCQVQWYNPDTALYNRSRIPCLSLEDENGDIPVQGCECKPQGRLALVMPEFCERMGMDGYFLARTGSMMDINLIDGYLRHVVYPKFDTLLGVPFIFGRAPQNISRPVKDKKTGKPTRIRTPMSVFHLRVDSNFVSPMFTLPRPLAALPAPTSEELREVSDDPPSPIVQEIDAPTAQPAITAGEGKALLTPRKGKRRMTDGANKLLGTEPPSAHHEPEVWSKDPGQVLKFLQAAKLTFHMDTADILTALNVICDPPIQNIADLDGVSKHTAWACCHAFHYEYDPARVSDLPVADDMTSSIVAIIDKHHASKGQ